MGGGARVGRNGGDKVRVSGEGSMRWAGGWEGMLWYCVQINRWLWGNEEAVRVFGV